MYLGPSVESKDYFSSLGFNCPASINPADYFLDVIGGTVPHPEDPNFEPSDLFQAWESRKARPRSPIGASPAEEEKQEGEAPKTPGKVDKAAETGPSASQPTPGVAIELQQLDNLSNSRRAKTVSPSYERAASLHDTGERLEPFKVYCCLA